MAPRPVPLAWRNLTHDPVRFGLFTLGIAFAVILMGVQLGVRNALIDGNCRVIDAFNADLVIVHPHRKSLFYRESFSRRTLTRAANVPGVAEAHPFLIDYQKTTLRNTAIGPDRGPRRNIRVLGYDPDANLLNLPDLSARLRDRLREPGTAAFDVRAKSSRTRPGETVFGPAPAEAGVEWNAETELNGKDLRLIGTFSFGTDFAADGTLIVSERTFVNWVREPLYPFSPEAMIDLGLLRVAAGERPADVRDRVRDVLFAGVDVADREVEVLTVPEFRVREVDFWLTMTPIGFAFGAGMALGFVVGTVICYQILSGNVADHLAEYATLRAIGYPNRFLSGVVLREAVILATAGFVPGLLVVAVTYAAVGAATGLPLFLTPGRFFLLLAATYVMCVGSGLLALRKAQTVDPANVF
jgi:putative ABC transport system permease protein